MKRNIQIIGVPIDLGQNKSGVDMGPAALRYAGLNPHLAALGHAVRDIGNIAVPIRETVADEADQHFLPSIAGTGRAVYQAARLALRQTHHLIVSQGAPHAAQRTRYTDHLPRRSTFLIAKQHAFVYRYQSETRIRIGAHKENLFHEHRSCRHRSL